MREMTRRQFIKKMAEISVDAMIESVKIKSGQNLVKSDLDIYKLFTILYK